MLSEPSVANLTVLVAPTLTGAVVNPQFALGQEAGQLFTDVYGTLTPVPCPQT